MAFPTTSSYDSGYNTNPAPLAIPDLYDKTPAIIEKPDGKKWSAEEYANAIMTALKQLRETSGVADMPFSIERIADKCGIPKTSYDTMGKTMMRLLDIRRIDRVKSGKSYRWKLRELKWDPKNPFALPTAYTKHSDEDDEEIDDKEESDLVLTENGIKLLEKYADEVAALRTEVKKKTEELAAMCAKATRSQSLKIEKYDGTTIEIKDVRPKQFERVVSLVKCRRNVLLYGPAGCGKTHLAEMVSRACGFERFGAISLNAGISDVHILGRSVPDLQKGVNNYQPSQFIEIFEKGGLFLFDELDAADPNVLLCINTALANGYIDVPNRPKKPRAVKHDDFLCMATANTIGKGATRQYVGRSQLDEATLDRFRIGMVECDYDKDVEAMLCPDDKLRTTLQILRDAVVKAGFRRVISTRFLRDAYIMISEGGWSHVDVYTTLTGSWADDEKAKLDTILKGGA